MPNATTTIAKLVASALILCSASMAQADDAAPWQVSKSSGEVWITTAGAQQVSLTADTKLNPGDSVRTGKNGRVLLIRGEERIMVSPNTAIGIPSEKRNDLPTTITQQSGTILLEVEKKNVQHFEVETPYLAAVVKGTQFQVTVEKGRSRVEVTRGQVQVSDFKSGQNVLVLPGQAARSVANGAGGLEMSGKDPFNTIEKGAPRQSTIRALNVPRGGLKAPSTRTGQNAQRNASASQAVRAGQGASHGAARAMALASPGHNSGISHNGKGGIRIGSTMGEVKLDFNKVTDGLARNASDGYGGARASADQSSGGQSSSSSSLSASSGLATEGSLGMGNAGNGGSSSSGGAAASGGGAGGVDKQLHPAPQRRRTRRLRFPQRAGEARGDQPGAEPPDQEHLRGHQRAGGSVRAAVSGSQAVRRLAADPHRGSGARA